MRPRPRARGRPLDIPDVQDLAEEVGAVRRAQGVPPVAVVAGRREWVGVRRQPGWSALGSFWPGGEETFCGVPVILVLAGEPAVYATQDELEEALLGR